MKRIDFIRDEILRLTDGGFCIFEKYWNGTVKLEAMTKSDLYPDTKPSAHIHRDPKSRICYLVDFGNPDMQGNGIRYVMLKFNISEEEAKARIIRDLGLNIQYSTKRNWSRPSMTGATAKKTEERASTSGERMSKTSYRYEKKAWSKEELDFWLRSDITREILEKYRVIPMKSFTGYSQEKKKPYTIGQQQGQLMFGYLGDKYVKVYRPGASQLRFCYGGRKPQPYVFGYDQLTHDGEMVFITGGEKDVLSLAAHGFEAICFNSETADIPQFIIDRLSREYKKVVLMYDSDETGINMMESAVDSLKRGRLIPLFLPLEGTKESKDITDFFAQKHTSEELLELVEIAVQEAYSDELRDLVPNRMNPEKPPRQAETILSINSVRICTEDNIMCITGPSGAGKSSLVNALASGALLRKTRSDIDTLGIDVKPNTDGHAVLFYDTEQSENDFFNNGNKIIARAGFKSWPEYFQYTHLLTHDRSRRLQLIEADMALAYLKYGGIHMVVIDGVADLIQLANDEGASVDVVGDLQRLANKYHTIILCVLHLTPNGLKIRGHLGSEMERKAACILCVDIDPATNSPFIEILKLRIGDKNSVPKIQFAWSDECDMFLYAGVKPAKKNRASGSTEQPQLSMAELSTFIFEADKDPIPTHYVIHLIKMIMKCQQRTAEGYMAKMKDEGLIKKAGKCGYVLASIDNEQPDDVKQISDRI